MAQVITNPTPKARFQESGQNVSNHRDLIGSREFERATDFALLEYQRQLSMQDISNLNTAAAAHIKMLGAMEFLQVLRNLSEAPTVPRMAPLTDNLDHKI